MKRIFFVWMILLGGVFFCSCKNEVKTNTNTNKSTADNKIMQQNDGSILLKVDKAECYQDMSNPSSNTAEWNVLITKSGRFNVWLSSATKDTTNLQYQNAVMLSILDNRMEVLPKCDKVVINSDDIKRPYFRADSFMGSLYIQDTGLFNVQVISEKIVPQDSNTRGTYNSRLLSVSLTPITR